MKKKPLHWMPFIAVINATKLPNRPGIRRVYVETCPRCGCSHLDKASADRCRHEHWLSSGGATPA